MAESITVIDDESRAIGKVRDALAGLRYGEVAIVVQDGVVVQVERTEQVRLNKRSNPWRAPRRRNRVPFALSWSKGAEGSGALQNSGPMQAGDCCPVQTRLDSPAAPSRA